MCSSVFKISETQVLKITDKDKLHEEGLSEELIDHRRILQPDSEEHTINALYIVATYPLLKTEGVTDKHRDELKAIFEEDGLDFTDDKLDNIGLTEEGIPMVIDRDAVERKSESLHQTVPSDKAVQQAGVAEVMADAALLKH